MSVQERTLLTCKDLETEKIALSGVASVHIQQLSKAESDTSLCLESSPPEVNNELSSARIFGLFEL